GAGPRSQAPCGPAGQQGSLYERVIGVAGVTGSERVSVHAYTHRTRTRDSRRHRVLGRRRDHFGGSEGRDWGSGGQTEVGAVLAGNAERALVCLSRAADGAFADAIGAHTPRTPSLTRAHRRVDGRRSLRPHLGQVRDWPKIDCCIRVPQEARFCVIFPRDSTLSRPSSSLPWTPWSPLGAAQLILGQSLRGASQPTAIAVG
ncbi:MAG: hypothetical protein ACI9K2_004521, partial [Myxococcota bacterium]